MCYVYVCACVHVHWVPGRVACRLKASQMKYVNQSINQSITILHNMEQLLNLVNNTAVCGQVDALFNDLAEHIQEIAVVQMFINYLWFEFPVGQKHRYTII